MAPQMIKLGHIDSSLMGLSMRVTFCIDKPLLLNVLSSASEDYVDQWKGLNTFIITLETYQALLWFLSPLSDT